MRSCATSIPSRPSSPTASSVFRPSTGHPDSARRAGCRSDPVRAHISGTDLVCDRAGNWMVLEDNLRIPSGTAYAIVNRRLLTKHLPELDRPPDLGDVDQVPPMLLETLRASAPPRCSRRAVGGAAVRRLGGLRLVRAHLPGRGDGHRARAVHRTCRCATENCCATSVLTFTPSTCCTPGWTRTCCCRPPDTTAARCGRVCSRRSPAATLTIANALGNGVADDKAIYAYVPAMIEYYLGEKPAAGPGADVDLRRTRPA